MCECMHPRPTRLHGVLLDEFGSGATSASPIPRVIFSELLSGAVIELLGFESWQKQEICLF
jgi:hypothetical protein